MHVISNIKSVGGTSKYIVPYTLIRHMHDIDLYPCFILRSEELGMLEGLLVEGAAGRLISGTTLIPSLPVPRASCALQYRHCGLVIRTPQTSRTELYVAGFEPPQPPSRQDSRHVGKVAVSEVLCSIINTSISRMSGTGRFGLSEDLIRDPAPPLHHFLSRCPLLHNPSCCEHLCPFRLEDT